jgi:hypothetical protein
MTMLGSGRADPFVTSRRSLGGPQYDQLADYCKCCYLFLQSRLIFRCKGQWRSGPLVAALSNRNASLVLWRCDYSPAQRNGLSSNHLNTRATSSSYHSILRPTAAFELHTNDLAQAPGSCGLRSEPLTTTHDSSTRHGSTSRPGALSSCMPSYLLLLTIKRLS